MIQDTQDGTELVEIRAIVRLDSLDRVIHAIRDAGCPRLTVTRVHSIGAGVDPDKAKLSLLEGTAFAEAAMVRLVCRASQAQTLTETICATAQTGKRGDGIVVEQAVRAVTKIRTGSRGYDALQ
jgi:nitrogen regulatory protein P-II 1/nitrogen regulatory protein P-II 2